MARESWDAFAADQSTALTDALAEAAKSPAGAPLPGGETETIYGGMAPTWLLGSARLRVLYYRRVIRTTTKTEIIHHPTHCPDRAPCMNRDESKTTTHGYGVELGMELELDANGALVEIHRYRPTPMPIDLLQKLHVVTP